MSIGSNGVQLSPPGGATFTVDAITDPNGNPMTVIDVDLGFQVTGTVSLPNYLQGTAEVCLYADELGGPFDGKVACSTIAITGKSGEPNPPPSVSYNWTITYNPATNVLPDPSKTSQLYHLAVVFVYGDPSWDIGSFVDLGMFLIN